MRNALSAKYAVLRIENELSGASIPHAQPQTADIVGANAMSNTPVPIPDRDWEDVDDIPWTLLDLEELVDTYWAVIAPVIETN
ncbi:hypothetical protein [Halomicrococcus sp. NG-SE-24]|uniref:hypothetical protein n=1 Tax=Halomicrococcus sp. NG-SE-24 TaxID=3436928 RepID=UPI003D977160